MDNSKNKEKAIMEPRKSQLSGSSTFSSDPSGRRRNKKEMFKNPSSITEEATLSSYTEASGSRFSGKERLENPSSLTDRMTFSGNTGDSGSSSSEKERLKKPSSLTEKGTSSIYSDPSGSRRSKRGQYSNPSSSTQGASSSAYTDTSGSQSEEKGSYRTSKGFMNGATAPVYAVNTPGTNFKKTGKYPPDNSSETFSTEQSHEATSFKPRPVENVRLMPFKVKDVMEMIKDNPTYKDKSPIMIKVKENDIDKILQQQNVIKGKTEPFDKYFKKPLVESPVSSPRSLQGKADSFRMSTGAESGRSKTSKESHQTEKSLFDDLGGVGRNQQVFAMSDVQAFPVVQTVSRPSRSRRRRRRRGRSRPRISPTPRRRTSRPRRYGSRPASRRSRVRRIMRRPMYRRPYRSPCTAYPMCDDNCPIRRPYRNRIVRSRAAVSNYNTPYYAAPQRAVSTSGYNTPYYANSTKRIASYNYNTPFTSDLRGFYYPENGPITSIASRRGIRGNCCCNTCEEKLQFIQPGLCSKKKNVWTNEYAVIPKPQVNLIDPCEELDPSIYPRADNPCIRDGQGNPLTDCIGRPLRSPIGKRFLNFTANGSVMETSVRGNFWTGQPPLCVKCPMPSGSCGPDTTHNWWMSCGYPIMPNMNPFYKRVLAAETGPC